MDAREAFSIFTGRVLERANATRLAALLGTLKGERRILERLHNDFAAALQSHVTICNDYSAVWDVPCYIFCLGTPFGESAKTVKKAYDALALREGWLILLQDGSAAIFRPENHWDREMLIIADRA